MRQKLGISWAGSNNDAKLNQFKRYLRDKGARQTTINDYLFRVEKYFEFCDNEEPSLETAQNTEIIY